MRNLLDKASAAQNLDGDRLKGSLLRPLKASVVRPHPSSKGSPTACAWTRRNFGGLWRAGHTQLDRAHADILRFVTAMGDIHQREG